MLGSTMCFPPSIFSIVVLPAPDTHPNQSPQTGRQERDEPTRWGGEVSQGPRVTCAVGADEKASLTGFEGEADVLDERRCSGGRLSVDSRIGEGEIPDLHRWRHGAWLPAVAGEVESEAELGAVSFGWWTGEEKRSGPTC